MVDMTDVKLPPPIWVSTITGFQTMLTELMRSKIVAVDTESNSLFAYRERVCLVQLSTLQTDYLVDPLALDIHPLGDFFSSPAIEKVFHAAEYDIICLRRDYHFTFNNLFDTMVAARLLKKPALGLASFLEEEYGVAVDKRHQRANWGERPIKPAMLEYARMDTHYLIPLRKLRAAELKDAGLWDLAQEDFKRLAESNGTLPAQPDCWSVAGREQLDPQQMAVLQGLVEYRERHARQINLPLFKIFGDQVLIDLARALPKNRKELIETGALSEKQFHRYGSELIEVVRRSVNNPVPKRRANHRPSEKYLNRYEKLKRWRVATAAEMKLESDVILPKDIMRAISDLHEITLESLEDVMRTTPWRYKQYAPHILKMLSDETAKGTK
jgi:ribonuclease D